MSDFNLSNSGFGSGTPQPSSMRKIELQPQQQPAQQQPGVKSAKGNNPFNIDNLFSFQKPDIAYEQVQKSPQMLNFLRAQKVANQFQDLTKPEYQVGKRLNFEA